MARVPEFERRQLASSVVGTPGEDRSGQIMFGEIADSVNKTTAAFTQLHQEREKAKNDTIVAKSQIDLLRNLEDETMKHEQEYANFKGDPRERTRAYEEKVNGLFQNTLNSLPTNESKVRFGREGYALINHARTREMKQASQQQATTAHNEVLVGINDLAMQASKLGGDSRISFDTKMQELGRYQTFAKNLIDKSSRSLTPEDKATLELNSPEAIAKGYAASAVVNAPHELLQAIESGKLDMLKPQELQQLKQGATDSFKKLKEQGEFNDLLEHIGSGRLAVLDKFMKGDSSAMIDLENLPEDPTNPNRDNALRNLLTGTPLSAMDSADTIIELNNKMSELEINVKNKTAKANASDVLAFIDTVVEKANDGTITKQTLNSYINKVSVPFYKKLKSGDGNSFTNALATGWKALNWPLSSLYMNKSKKEQVVGMYQDFETILSQQKVINADTIASSLKQARQIDANRRHPSLTETAGSATDVSRANGFVAAVGTPGTATKKADKKVTPEKMVKIKGKNGKIYPLSEADSKEFIAAGYEVVG